MPAPSEPLSKTDQALDRLWDRYAESSANQAMVAFAGVARNKRLSMRAVAKKIGVDVKAFQKYFRSKNPELPTMVKVAKALDLPPRVARALVGALTPLDITIVSLSIRTDITVRGARLFGDDLAALKAEREFERWCEDRQNRAALAQVCAAVILAWDSISNKQFRSTDWATILGPEIAAAERIMSLHGFSLRPFVQDEAAIIEAQLEGRSWLHLMLLKLGVSDSDERQIRKILEPYGITYDIYALADEAFAKTDEKLDRYSAESAAEEAYRERLKGRSAFDFMTHDEYKNEDLYRERQLRELLPDDEAERLLAEMAARRGVK
jgi:transcriptional regulator with XRE-family HTH domain